MIYQIVNPLNGINVIKNANVIKTNELSKNKDPDASMEEIILDETLSYTENQTEFQSIIQFALTKLRLGGQMTITDIDLNVLCEQTLKEKDKTKFNEVISYKRNIHSWSDVKKIISQYKNIKVKSIKLDGAYYILRCTKI